MVGWAGGLASHIPNIDSGGRGALAWAETLPNILTMIVGGNHVLVVIILKLTERTLSEVKVDLD